MKSEIFHVVLCMFLTFRTPVLKWSWIITYSWEKYIHSGPLDFSDKNNFIQNVTVHSHRIILKSLCIKKRFLYLNLGTHYNKCRSRKFMNFMWTSRKYSKTAYQITLVFFFPSFWNASMYMTGAKRIWNTRSERPH